MSDEPLPASLLSDSAVLSSTDVTVGGVSLRDLAATYGTPLFVYDEATLRNRCREAVKAFDDGVAFASKSFPAVRWPTGLRGGALHRRRDGWGARHRAAFRHSASRVIVHGNNKSRQEVERALHEGVHRLVVDNFDEIDLLGSLVSAQQPSTASCA